MGDLPDLWLDVRGGGVSDINDQLWSRLGIIIWKEIDLASEVNCIHVSTYYKSTFYFPDH